MRIWWKGSWRHLFQIAKYLCLKITKWFVSICKIFVSQIDKMICFKLQNICVSNWQKYCFQYAKYLCLKLTKILFSNCKVFVSQIDQIICFKLQPTVRKIWWKGRWRHDGSLIPIILPPPTPLSLSFSTFGIVQPSKAASSITLKHQHPPL